MKPLLDVSLIWPSPAKLNLFLHVNSKRSDGYHELQTLFQMLDWGDRLTITATTNDAIQLLNQPSNIAEHDNLIFKAAMALKQQTNCQLGAIIDCDKIIPMGGGVGGGSSNAATILVALNHQWQLGLSSQQLQAIGLTLGADVPIFVAGKTAFAEGVGEIIKPIHLPQKYYLVIHPNIHVSTAAAFASKELQRNTAKLAPCDYSYQNTRNDFEPVVKSLFPEVANTIDWLLEYAPARLTGTGACVFAPFEYKATADAILRKLPERWRGFVVKGVNTSPLITKLNEYDIEKFNNPPICTED